MLIVRLHSGHHPVLGAYLHCLDRDIGSARPTCKEEDHTLHDWLIARLAVDCLRQKNIWMSKGKARVGYYLP